MCSICGILGDERSDREKILLKMNEQMTTRGPDQNGIFICGDAAFAHNRLAVIDVENGIQPMTRTYEGRDYTIIYNGEIYNSAELAAKIKECGAELQTRCDTEIVLYMYILFGKDCASMLNGIFAFAVYDSKSGEVYMARDRMGVKPLFYTEICGKLIFASEIKSLLQYPGVKTQVDKYGLWELVFLSPTRENCIFKGISELKSAHYLIWKNGKATIRPYWTLKAAECADTREEIIEKTRTLLTDAIKRQLVSDVPLSALLSGGLDSSIISSVAARYYENRGMTLDTYSFEYEGNKENFKGSMFQPQSDDEYAVYMAGYLGTRHHVLTAGTTSVAEALEKAVIARDFPGQADVDSSLALFCAQIKENHTVALSGECADEIFGGYPWFYKPEMLYSSFFPWIHSPMARVSLFRDEFIHRREGYDYISEIYKYAVHSCPTLESDTEEMKTSRAATWLSVNYFMASLLERKDRMSMASSVEVRVPFADHRILEYVYNVPWEIKFEGGVEKALLRNAMSPYLPDKILNRKKSPYPKTQNPEYERITREMLNKRLEKKDSALNAVIDKENLESFLSGEDKTWFGQLMSRPQLIAWLLQFDVWAEKYNVDFV